MSRIQKQFAYGLVYLLILLVVGGIWYMVSFRPDPSCSDGRQNQGEEQIDCGGACVSCAEKYGGKQEPLQVRDASFFVVSHVLFFAGEVFNPNVVYGAEEFLYRFIAYGEGDTVLDIFEGVSRVGPRGKVLVHAADARVAPNEVFRVSLEVQPIMWVPAAGFAEFTGVVSGGDPQVVVEDDRITITGTVRNDSVVRASRVEIVIVARDALGFRLFMTGTELAHLRKREERSFSIAVPFEENIARKIVEGSVEVLVYPR
jgi:hypothetical protein